LQDARKAIEMFRQMKVDIVGMVENMSYFVCPHCQHEIDIFSRGGAEKTAKQFGIAYLGSVELDPEIRKAGDGGTADRASRRRLASCEVAVRLRAQCGGASRRDQSRQLGERDSDSVGR
jgi:hypothetical protein